MREILAALNRAVGHPRGRRALIVAVAAAAVVVAAVAAGYWIHRVWWILAVPAWIVTLIAAATAVAHGQPDTDD
jgi:hypothetical protein